jgi:hypothetical protein
MHAEGEQDHYHCDAGGGGPSNRHCSFACHRDCRQVQRKVETALVDCHEEAQWHKHLILAHYAGDSFMSTEILHES